MRVTDKAIATRECTSCQMCAVVCPKEAIKIALDDDGFFRPFINDESCIDCGICTKVCYKFDSNLQITSAEELGQKKLFSAWSKDDTLLKVTTSGGIGDLLARQFIKDGYKVVGVAYNDAKIRAEHQIATTKEDTHAFRGSKYIQSYTFNAFKEIINCDKQDKYAVFGTPCQIYALNRYATRKGVRDKFVFIDLYCHGCPSIHIWKKYQDYIKQKLGISSFEDVRFRSKVRGWGAFDVEVINHGQTVFKSNPQENGFYELFFSDQILNEGCHSCKLRGTLEYTDIRMGDFWGKKFLTNQRGVSGISISTPEGDKFFSEIKNSISYKEEDYSEFLPYQTWSKTYKPNQKIRTEVLDSLKNPNKDIKDAVQTFHRLQTVKGTIRRHIKNALYYLPLKYTMSLKRLFS